MPFVLSAQNLTKSYGKKKPVLAVDQISFDLSEGEILGLLGPNGSGKTTTIQMLLGTLSTTSGAIQYFGKDFAKHRTEVLNHVSFASTYLSLPYILTVAENLEVIGYLYGFNRKESRKRFDPLLERFGIAKYRAKRIAALSTGQLTRLMIVKAFFVDPKIVLLDEPTASLDPDISRDICEFLLERREKTGLAILFTSHKMEEVTQVCDRVTFLNRGKIIANDLPKNLAKKSAFFRLHLTIIENMEVAVKQAETKKYAYTNDERTIEVEMGESDVPDYLHFLSQEGVIYSGIHIQEPSLQDYFLKIARGEC